MTWVISFLGACFMLTVSYAFYNAFLHPLRRYPGPLLWRAFRFPYVISVHKGDIHRRLNTYHNKYGPVVRIAPDELSYSHGAAWKDIYSSRPNHLPLPRNPTWFKKMSPDEPDSIMGYNEQSHARFRRAFANSFSEKNLLEQAPVIESYVDAFMAKLKSMDTVDLNQWLNFLTFDISGDLSFGESFDCIKNGKAHPWVEIAQDFGKGLAFISSINQYPPFHKLLRYIIPKNIMQRTLDHRSMSAEKAQKRLALEIDRPDFVTPAKKFGDQKNAISDKEWEINMSILVFAGSETAASALTGIVRQLVQNLGVMVRLTQELRDAFIVEKDISIASTARLPYLNAVISEGLRLCPPVAIGVPRVVPPGGSTILSQYVPAGTYVAFNQFSAFRQSSNFRSPNSFLPERFLHPEDGDDVSAFQPFGIGRHSCIGVKVAWAVMRVSLARLVWEFHVRLADEGDNWDWGSQDTYIFWVSDGVRWNGACARTDLHIGEETFERDPESGIIKKLDFRGFGYTFPPHRRKRHRYWIRG
ncbi:benzoate 4-monooxygenase cytochrome P450 [Pleomassaria siparia CBS 279.74]|uniref:Benzoate 4-monooxygenase cytochrome P450 n=1 Tax=Pleomassaria siparia CBS 279.74 TaxID=1314801 RepID=A0A6G1JWR2_9PLEO|nr:benzoate 4-monooxygenase cytochrome P450 [Pleomassaria siparia CBS 279.74]